MKIDLLLQVTTASGLSTAKRIAVSLGIGAFTSSAYMAVSTVGWAASEIIGTPLALVAVLGGLAIGVAAFVYQKLGKELTR